MREPGFYWIRWKDSGYLTIAELSIPDKTGEYWEMTGRDGDYDPSDFEVISDRLIPPV